MIKALAPYKDHSGCDYHRIRLPFLYSEGYLDNGAFSDAAGDIDKLLSAAELVVYNREFPLPDVNLGAMRMRRGFKVVLDLDDYWVLNAGHYLEKHYKTADISARIIGNIRQADAVTVTTERLAERVRPLNPKVYVLPNALPYGHGQFKFQQREPDGIFRFIYAGQRSHLPDLKGIQGPLRRIAGERNPKIGFTLAGYAHNPKDVSGIWPKMESILSAGGAMLNYTRIDNRPLDAYMRVYSHADAVLVPLEANYFNSCKSNLKLLEAAAYNLPVICQRVPPYSDCIDAPALWVESQSDWYRHMKFLVANPNAAEDYGNRLNEWAVKNYNLFTWNKTRFELYQDIVNR